MKKINEIKSMLDSEILESRNSIVNTKDSYNTVMGKTSYLLAAFVGLLLKQNNQEWKTGKWMDDSILEGVMYNDVECRIWGVMIFGTEDSTEQWTEPFLYISRDNGKSWLVFYGDKNHNAYSYDNFRFDREYWKDPNWDRDWRNKFES